MDEHLFADTAGAIPSNGVVVRGLRTFVRSRHRELTPASLVRGLLLWRFASTDWGVVVVERAGSGARITERRFRSIRRARSARRRFVATATAMSDADFAAADWAQVLEDAARS